VPWLGIDLAVIRSHLPTNSDFFHQSRLIRRWSSFGVSPLSLASDTYTDATGDVTITPRKWLRRFNGCVFRAGRGLIGVGENREEHVGFELTNFDGKRRIFVTLPDRMKVKRVVLIPGHR